MSRTTLLRLILPALHQLETRGGTVAWRSPPHGWGEAPYERLDDVAGRWPARRLEVALHPDDVSLTELQMPALPPRQMQAAVMGEVELLALDSPESRIVGHGPRNAHGRVPVAWVSRAAVTQMVLTLRQKGLIVSAIVPPHLFLEAPAAEPDAAGTALALRMDGWAVLRTGPHEGQLLPLPVEGVAADQVDERLQAALPEGMRIRWLPGLSEARGPMPERWSGEATWSLPPGVGPSAAETRDWTQAVVGWSAALVVVWAAGLHLQARQMAQEGQALRHQMAARLKQTFPEVTVVLNPLQQARQLREAQRVAGGMTVGAEGPSLLRAAAQVLTQAQAQVQQLTLDGGELRVRWRVGHSLSPVELQGLQARARERGLQLLPDAQGVRLRADPVPSQTAVPSVPAVPAVPAAPPVSTAKPAAAADSGGLS